MPDTVIRVASLSKKYVIKHAGKKRSGDGLRHAIGDGVAAYLRKFKSKLTKHGQSVSSDSIPKDAEDFYALKEVSFEVKRGEVVGIIGRNGAGKSTLLKILSRITDPSSGRIGIKGRVASLLEVGTGFHPELTGRENIFLNGAILGMTKAEVTSKFDEIVNFAGVEKFLNIPVKRYSSGMYVRLAFAVAAYLEPEILIVDEVLAVGDGEFQEKCLGKMKDVAAGGRTVLFVSHNMSAVAALCDRAILLQNGRVILDDRTPQVLQHYLTHRRELATRRKNRGGSGEYRFTNFAVMPEISQPHELRTFAFEFEQVEKYGTTSPFVIIEIIGERGDIAARCDTRLTGDYIKGATGVGTIVIKTPWLKPGTYWVNACLDSGHGFVDVWEASATFQVGAQLPYGTAVSEDAYASAGVLSDFTSQLVIESENPP